MTDEEDEINPNDIETAVIQFTDFAMFRIHCLTSEFESVSIYNSSIVQKNESIKVEIQKAIKVDVDRIYLCLKRDLKIKIVNTDILLEDNEVFYFVVENWHSGCEIVSQVGYNRYMCMYEPDSQLALMFRCEGLTYLSWLIDVMEPGRGREPLLQYSRVWRDQEDNLFWLECDRVKRDWSDFMLDRVDLGTNEEENRRFCIAACRLWNGLYEMGPERVWYLDTSEVFLEPGDNIQFLAFHFQATTDNSTLDDVDYRVQELEREKGMVRQCGILILSMFIGRYNSDVEEALRFNELESLLEDIPDSVVEVVRACLLPLNQRPSFLELARVPLLITISTVHLTDILRPSYEFEHRVSYTWHGLQARKIVDLVARHHNANCHDVFLCRDKRIFLSADVIDFRENYSLSYFILANINRFERKKQLGKGAFGMVYEYLDVGSQRLYAMKKFSKAITNQDKLISFLNEICTFQKMNHPRVIRYLGCCHENRKSIYIQMELMQSSLGAIVRESKSGLPIEAIRHYSRQILQGLNYLHSQFILHRDLKCDNVLVKDGCIKLADFGLAKTMTQSRMNLPVRQSQVGTCYAMAPEIINDEPYDYKVDIWSFGATVWEMASGKPPFSKLYAHQIYVKVALNKCLEENKAIPKEVQDFIDWCTRPEPSDRPSTEELMSSAFIQT